MDCH
jgi:hypothetical protein